MIGGIIELDLHNMNTMQAQVAIDAQLRRATAATYRIRLIHGYQRGTAIRDMVRAKYRKHHKVLRIELSLNPGQTDLILREI